MKIITREEAYVYLNFGKFMLKLELSDTADIFDLNFDFVNKIHYKGGWL
jgi:hypothetical protein